MIALSFYAVAVIYSFVGLMLSCIYLYSERLRSAKWFHLVTLFVVFVATSLATSGASSEHNQLTIDEYGRAFFVFSVAILFYVPVLVFLAIHYWDLLLNRLFFPSAEPEVIEPPATMKEWWQLLYRTLDVLKDRPSDVRLRLRVAHIYQQLGYYDAAAYEFLRASEWLPRGYSHGHVLYKAAYILVEKRHEVPRALPVLRRLIRLYPKSYFASYARRIVNRHESHEQPSNGPSWDLR